MPYKVCIIDDEIDAQLVIQKHLENNFPEIKIVGKSSNLEDAKSVISEFRPDFIFLDIQLGNESGLELAKTLIGTSIKVIFTTAFEKYAIEAIRLKAMEYLLKPVFKAEFVAAIDSVIKELKLNEQKGVSTLSIAIPDGKQIVKIDQVIYLEADGSYCIIHLVDGSKIVASKPLRHFEESVSDSNFFRCHKSFVVGIMHINLLKTNHVELNNGKCVPVSRHKRGVLKKLINA